MKKVIILIVIAISYIGYGQEEMPINADFGGNRCNGAIGLCSISKGQGIMEKGPDTLKFTAKKVSDIQFQLIIYRSKISEEEEMGIVGKKLSTLGNSGVFRMEEDFIMDNQVVAEIGLKQGYIIIPKGEYPMTIDNHKAYISFTVVKP
ncbi:MAG: hypothetical protein WBF83_12045 [Moheibacter sp.]